jgi:hypothetical protein
MNKELKSHERRERLNYVVQNGQYVGYLVNLPVVVQAEDYEQMISIAKDLAKSWVKRLQQVLEQDNSFEVVHQDDPIQTRQTIQTPSGFRSDYSVNLDALAAEQKAVEKATAEVLEKIDWEFLRFMARENMAELATDIRDGNTHLEEGFRKWADIYDLAIANLRASNLLDQMDNGYDPKQQLLDKLWNIIRAPKEEGGPQ